MIKHTTNESVPLLCLFYTYPLSSFQFPWLPDWLHPRTCSLRCCSMWFHLNCHCCSCCCCCSTELDWILKLSHLCHNYNNNSLCRDAVDGYGITECGSLACLSNPCRNGGRCMELEPQSKRSSPDGNTIGLTGGQRQRQPRMDRDTSESSASSSRDWSPSGVISRATDYQQQRSWQRSETVDGDDYLMMTETEEEEEAAVQNWKCKCPTGYIGATCETSVCDNNPCQYGGTCIPYPGSGYLCLCPFGKHGHYCEHSE